MTSDIYALRYVLNLTETMFPVNTAKNTRVLPNLPVQKASVKKPFFAGICSIGPKVCVNCPPTEKLHTSKSEEISAICPVEGAFAIIYLCFLLSVRLIFFDKICLI